MSIILGTSSLRRTAQIRRQYPHLVVCDIRGNLNTRLAKLDAENSKFAGVILAQAGLVRMGWHDRISQILEPTDLLYAVGQGALAVECRANDFDVLGMLRSLMCLPTTCRILAERSFLKTLGGGCSAPVAVYSKIGGDTIQDENTFKALTLTLDGAVWSLDGSVEIRDKKFCSLAADIENNNVDNHDNSNEEPPLKRSRVCATSNVEGQNSPPIINDDGDIETLTESYNMEELVEKHINLARKCPVVNSEIINETKNDSENNKIGGDADTNCLGKACPLPIVIGTDVMGKCPFVGNETKISLSAACSSSVTKNISEVNCNNSSSDKDETDCAPSKPVTSKCPFSSMHYANDPMFAKGYQSDSQSSVHGKCPFLTKTIKLFDYGDDEKPRSQHLENLLIETGDNLFCGLYQHACDNRDLYVKCNLLGQQLAEDLIKKGALEVMKSAQAEIHSKS